MAANKPLTTNYKVNNKIKEGLLLSVNIFLIGEYMAKLQARAWLSHVLCGPGQHAAKRRHKLYSTE